MGSVAIAKIHLAKGNIDEAFLNVTEAIKILQTKNDKDGIFECLLCMHHLLGIIGYKKEEKMIIEHMLLNSYNSKNPYMFALSACNYA